MFLGAKGILYSVCVHSVMLYGSDIWPVKEEDERNYARMVTWRCNITHEDRISAEEFRTRLKMKNRMEYLQDRRQQWLGHLERMEESAWSCR